LYIDDVIPKGNPMHSTKPQEQKLLFGDFVYDRIPKDHLLYRMNQIIDFSFIDQETRDLYSTIGRPGCSPIMLFKCCLVAFLYDISDRTLEEQINYNIVFKWFVGLDIDQNGPDHSTMTRFRDRLGAEGFTRIFNRIVELAREKKLINDRLTIIDSTHVIAKVDTARLKKFKKDDDDHTFIDLNSPDPDARFGHKSKKKLFYGYKDHTAMDADSAIVTAVETTPGNVPDGDMLPQLIVGKPETVTADKAYDGSDNYTALAAAKVKSAIIPMHRSPGRPPKAEKERPKIEAKYGEVKRLYGKAHCRWLGLSKAFMQALITFSVANLKRITARLAPPREQYA
jgi:IS5 family transposase